MGIFHLTLSKIHEILNGKDLEFLSSTKLEFLKSDLYFWYYEHLKLMFFKRIGPRNFWSFAVGTSTDFHSFISEYFHSIFRSKVECSMLNKTTQNVFHWWAFSQGCGSGSWKRSFFCGSGSAKILPLPHRLFDLKSNLAKNVVHFPMCIKRWSCTISLNKHVIWVVRENDIKHN